MNVKIMEMIAKTLAPHLRKMLARLDRLEAMAGIGPDAKNLADAYKGCWAWGSTHERGALLTDRSSLWLCTKSTDARPGDAPDCWKLVSKHGKAPRGSE